MIRGMISTEARTVDGINPLQNIRLNLVILGMIARAVRLDGFQMPGAERSTILCVYTLEDRACTEMARIRTRQGCLSHFLAYRRLDAETDNIDEMLGG